MDPKIFITYSSKDQKVARTICTALENRGLACWISSRNVKPGQNYQEQIVRAIRGARIMVLVFTANANNSNEIKKELALASQNNLVVIPVRIEDVAPNEAFAYEFATRQWIDLFEDWEKSMAELVELIAAILNEPPAGDRAKAASGTDGRCGGSGFRHGRARARHQAGGAFHGAAGDALGHDRRPCRDRRRRRRLCGREIFAAVLDFSDGECRRAAAGGADAGATACRAGFAGPKRATAARAVRRGWNGRRARGRAACRRRQVRILLRLFQQLRRCRSSLGPRA